MVSAMSPLDPIRTASARGGASLRHASWTRRLVGGLSLLALLAASPARATTAAPVPGTPADAIALLKWCWENRDATLYHELFADNFQYFYDAGNPAGAPYQSTPWSRYDELVSGSNLFLGAGSTHAPASSVTLTFTDGPTVQPNPAGFPSPWHQLLAAQWTLDITCTDGSTLHGAGNSKWFVVRGDSAQIPQELKDRGFTQDPGRWYIERWLEEPTTAPVVIAPSVASGVPFSAITVHVTALDPDADPISSLVATESGYSPSFSATSDHTAGTFTWIPIPTDIGPHGVTFTAGNSLYGSATTTLNVVAANQPPVPVLTVTPPGGAAPLSVTADGSGSSDPEGRVVSFRFNFGDGTAVGPQSSPTATHTYPMVGSWILALTVIDDLGASSSISARVTTSGVPVASVSVSPASASFNVGGTQQLTATPKDAGGNALTGRSITWASDNTAVATVNSGGLVAGLGGGTAHITATCEGKSGTSVITVIVPPVVTVSVTPPSANVAIGATQQMTATPRDAGGNVLTGRTITWASDNAAATVNSSGLVKGIAVGSANVTATCEGKIGSSAITVTASTDPLAGLPNLVRNPSFETDLSGWGPFYGSTIARVTGGYDGLYALQMIGTTALDWGFGVNDSPDWIRPTTAAGKTYRFTARVRSAANHGFARIRVREYSIATKALLGQISSLGVSLTNAWQTQVVDYTTLSAGSTLDLQVKESPLVANEVFLTDDISIKDITGVPGVTPAAGEIESGPDGPAPDQPVVLSFRAAVYPSPVQASAVLSFATTRSGALRVDLLDLAGRAVRRLEDESDAAAGMHTLTIDGMRDDGRRMRAGMYFYRIVADEGRITGRFVMLK
jgi:uncharacterized protein YjdB